MWCSSSNAPTAAAHAESTCPSLLCCFSALLALAFPVIVNYCYGWRQYWSTHSFLINYRSLSCSTFFVGTFPSRAATEFAVCLWSGARISACEPPSIHHTQSVYNRWKIPRITPTETEEATTTRRVSVGGVAPHVSEYLNPPTYNASLRRGPSRSTRVWY